MRRIISIALVIFIIISVPSMFAPRVQAWFAEPGLYAGISDPASVYRYDGTTWTLIGSFPDDYAVLSLITFGGQLFAGTMTPRTYYPEPPGIGRVYRYEGGTTWTLVGDNLANEVNCLAVYEGDLYAGTSWKGYYGTGGGLYRYDGGTTWTRVVELGEGWEGFRSAYAWGNILCLGDVLHHMFGHYDGTEFTVDWGQQIWCESINDYEVYQGTLYAGAMEGWTGVLYNSSDGTTWEDMRIIHADSGTSAAIWGLETFTGNLDIGLGNGTLLGWDGSTFFGIWSTPDEQGIRSMETSVDLENLFIGVGGRAGGYGDIEPGIGRVYRYDGTTAQLISGDMGNGVQVLYAAAPFPQQAIPEVPLGTILTSSAMIVALVAYLIVPKWRRKRE